MPKGRVSGLVPWDSIWVALGTSPEICIFPEAQGASAKAHQPRLPLPSILDVERRA